MGSDPQAPYSVYKADMSYFSGKFEAYLRYKQIPHETIDVDMHIMNTVVYPATGFRKVPAVKTVNGEWLLDSTPMIRWFEARYPDNPVLPNDPALAFLALLIEDYGDEWLWRPAMWWRWEPMPSRLALSNRIGALAGLTGPINRLFGAVFAWRQRREWLWNDGITKQNVHQVRDLYLEELDFLQAVFEKQPYVLGSHPSVADFGYYGSMFRHFHNDPDPGEVMRRRSPAVHEWIGRLWNESPNRLAADQAWQWPEGEHWQPLLQRITTEYLPYLHQNAVAFRAGKKRFDFKASRLEWRGTITTDYRVWCRQELQRRYAEIPDHAKQRIDGLFASAGGLEALHLDGEIDAGMDENFSLPLPKLSEKPKRPSVRLALLGQPRN